METLEYQLGLYAATCVHALLALPLLGTLYVIGKTFFEERRKTNRRRFSLRRFSSYKKVGGIHFVKLGRFGCSFWLSKRKK